MMAAISVETEDGEIVYLLTEDSEAILAHDDPIFIEDLDDLRVEIATRHETPEGFTNLRDASGSEWSSDIRLTEDGRLTGRGHNSRPISGKGFSVLPVWSTKASRETVEKIARDNPARKIYIDGEEANNWVDPKWKNSNLQVFPDGEFLIRPTFGYWSSVEVEVEYNPKQAKALIKQRATKKKNAVANGEPKIELLKDVKNALCDTLREHPVMMKSYLVIGDGRDHSVQSKGEHYRYLPRFARTVSTVWNKRRYQQNPQFHEAIEALLPYREGLLNAKPVEVPEPDLGADRHFTFKHGWSVKNQTQINKANNHNEAVKHAVFFVKWLTLQAKACGLEDGA